MKKIFCLLLMLMLAAMPAMAQGSEMFSLWFEEGFCLHLPEGWMSHPVDETSAEKDIRYILGDSEGSRYLYILIRESVHPSMQALDAALAAHETYEKTGDLIFNGQQFLAFIDPTQNISGCMTLLDGDLLSFIFTPQDDSDYMLLAASIMNCYEKSK